MKRTLGKPILTSLLLCAGGLAATLGSAQASVRVGGWSLTADGQIVQGFNYTGHCPANLKFAWGVIGNAPDTVAYSFTRSDGAHSGPKEANLPKANQSVPVYEEWHLGAPTPQFKNYKGWVELQVASPNPLKKKVNFTLHCNG